jgi:hypothetical protein
MTQYTLAVHDDVALTFPAWASKACRMTVEVRPFEAE